MLFLSIDPWDFSLGACIGITNSNWCVSKATSWIVTHTDVWGTINKEIPESLEEYGENPFHFTLSTLSHVLLGLSIRENEKLILVPRSYLYYVGATFDSKTNASNPIRVFITVVDK